MEKVIKGIVFDMGGVLASLDLPKCIDNFLKIGFSNVRDFINEYHQEGFVGEFENGLIGEEEFIGEALKHCASGTSGQDVKDSFISLLSGVFPGVRALMDDLSGNYDLFILSNNNPICSAAFEKMLKNEGVDVDKVFKDMFYSFRMKLLKPGKEIYQEAIRRSGYEAGELLFIDDSRKNIAGAEAQGINTLLFDGKSNLYDFVMDYLESNGLPGRRS